MKTYAIYAEMEKEPRCYVEAKDINDLVRIMRERNKNHEPNGMFPGWCPVEINSEKNNPKIISLTDYTEYRETLSQVIEKISAISDEIQDNLFNLACHGKWKEWDKQQPIGAEFYVDENMIRDTGDKNIDLLWEMLDKINEIKEKINN